jgi:hypothetical protein
VSALFGCQGLVLLAAGVLAEQTGPRTAVALVALPLALIVAVMPGLRSAPQENLQSVR